MTDQQFDLDHIFTSEAPVQAAPSVKRPTLSPLCDICGWPRTKRNHTKCSQQRKALYEQQRAAGKAKPAKFN